MCEYHLHLSLSWHYTWCFTFRGKLGGAIMANFWTITVAVCLLSEMVKGSVLTKQPLLNWDEELGVDMCPGCRPITAPITLADCNFDEEDLPVEMCPEIRQPLSLPLNNPVHPPEKDTVSLVKELQHLVKVQQLQVDQLADILQQLGKTESRVDFVTTDQKGMGAKQQASGSKESDFIVSDKEVQEQQPLKDSLDQELVGTKFDENSVLGAAGIAEMSINGDGHGSGVGSMTVARYRPAWSEHFSFLSAVKVDGEVSCLHVLPQEGDDGISRYVVIGDMTGRLYIFMWLGDLLLDYTTISTAPITAMLSYTLLKNETILVTGHADGGVLVHQILETEEEGSVSGDGRTTLFSIEALHSLVPPSPCKSRVSVGDRKDPSTQETGNPDFGKVKRFSVSSDVQSVTNLEMYKVGKMRYTLVSDMSGKIQLFRDNGSLYGVAESPSRPLAFMRTPSAQRLVFLTEVGVGSLDLRSMLVRSSHCEGLNTSTVMSYAFDVTGRSKANGFTPDGDLVYVALTGDMLHFECHVKKKRKVQIAGPFAPQALKGYLLAATPDHVLVFNTTLHMGFSYENFWVGGPRPLFSASMNEIALSFIKTPITRSRWPVMASNRDKLVVVGFGHGYVGFFRSNLPVAKPADFSAKFWSSPVLISCLVLLGIWQLFTRRREPGTIITSEYPLVSSGASTYREVENVRLGFGERETTAEPRRYRSPTRGYVPGNPTTFGTSSRTFRPSVDSGSYSARREPLFSSTQPVGELRQVELQ